MNMVLGRVIPLTLIGVGMIILAVSFYFMSGDPAPPPDGASSSVTSGIGDTEDVGVTGPGPELPPPVVADLPRMRFAGQVIDVSTGIPVPGATVAFRNLSGSTPLGHARTRAGGEFAVDIPECTRALITVRSSGYATGRWQWGPDMLPDAESSTDAHAEDLFLAISPESVLWVSVEAPDLDLQDAPLVEVRILQSRTARELGAAVKLTPQRLVDSELRIGGLLAGRHLVSLRAGSRVLARREVEVGEGEEREVLFQLGPAIQIFGEVLRNGIPVEGGTVQTWCRQTQASSSIPVAVDGRFETRLPGPGSWRFIWTSPLANGEGTSLEMELSADAEIVIELRTGSLEGRVVGPGGEPMVGMQGSLFGPRPFSFTTDETGRFSIEEIPYGLYRWVFLHQPEGVFAPRAQFEVSGATSEQFQFHGASRLLIQVSKAADEYSRPEDASAPVYRIAEDGSLSPLKRTENSDEFWWPRQGGLGVVYQRGWTPFFFTTGPVDHPVPVEALLQPGGEVTVTLVGLDGEVLADHPFTIEPLSAPDLPTAWTHRATGPRGSCRVTLAPGEYEISTHLDSGPATATIFIAPQQSTRLRLP